MPKPVSLEQVIAETERRQRRGRHLFIPIAVLGGAAVIGALIGSAFADERLPGLARSGGAALAGLWRDDAPAATVSEIRATYLEAVAGCTVTDGDTIRCGGERIRLLAIDAPELPGHCRPGRVCAPGDPHASTSSLRAALIGGLTIERVGTDHYGRTLARVAGSMGDLSCWQLAHGQAIYKPAWDNGYHVAISCPASVL